MAPAPPAPPAQAQIHRSPHDTTYEGLDMIDSKDLQSIAGNTMTGQDGQKIGKIVDVYESTQDADGTFVTVHTGMFGGNASFVPLAKASMQGKDVVVPYDKALVKDAPRVEADQELTSAEEERLYQHYSLGVAAAPTAPAPTPTKDRAQVQDDAMTRSEERLQVGTQQVETGRAKLRKRIVTENVSTTVPVTHERAVVTSEPITEANRDKAMDGPVLTEAVHEVALHDEQVVVDKETVAVERVKLGTQTVTEQATVNETVRKEQIETEDPTGEAGKPRR